MIKNILNVSLIFNAIKNSSDYLLRFSWLSIFIALLIHFTVTWWLMLYHGEKHLAEPVQWVYFFITTATTVGYGDLTPQTQAGKLVTTFFIMPGAVLFFAAIIGKFSTIIVSFWKRAMHGTANYSHLKDHIIIAGWHADKTPRMIDLIESDQGAKSDILIYTSKKIEHPCPEKTKFVRGNSLTDRDTIIRAGIENASRIIIFRSNDDITLSTCLAITATQTKAHIVAWFDNATLIPLVKAHCPNIEYHSDIISDLLVRSAQDPGSSRIQEQLLSTLHGPTQFSVQVPSNFPGTEFGSLLNYFKKQHEAMALAIADSTSGDDLKLNPDSNSPVVAGQIVYFIAEKRITLNDIRWHEILSEDKNF